MKTTTHTITITYTDAAQRAALLAGLPAQRVHTYDVPAALLPRLLALPETAVDSAGIASCACRDLTWGQTTLAAPHLAPAPISTVEDALTFAEAYAEAYAAHKRAQKDADEASRATAEAARPAREAAEAAEEQARTLARVTAREAKEKQTLALVALLADLDADGGLRAERHRRGLLDDKEIQKAVAAVVLAPLADLPRYQLLDTVADAPCEHECSVTVGPPDSGVGSEILRDLLRVEALAQQIPGAKVELREHTLACDLPRAECPARLDRYGARVTLTYLGVQVRTEIALPLT